MMKRMICVGVLVCLLCTSCGHFHTDVSNGDEVIISNALQEKKDATQEHDAAGLETTEQPSASPSPDAWESIRHTEDGITDQDTVSATYVPIISQKKLKLYNDTGTAVVGDTGFEIYNYVSSAAETYAKTINSIGRKLGPKYHIYDMIVPTSVGITLPDNKADKVNSSDQQESIQKLYKKIKEPIQKIDLYDILMQHRTEYIYYRTDHHWSALGAYYAYRQYCIDTARTPYELSQYQKASFGNFIGTFYGDSGKNEDLRTDKVSVYYPMSTQLSMKTRTDSGKMVDSSVIEDASGYGVGAKYCAFLGGDNAYSIITNKEIEDDSACLVVKESYGNALVPYLADHYHKVYVVDYRYWTGKISTLAKQNKVQDILIVNNISMTRNAYLIGKLSQILH